MIVWVSSSDANLARFKLAKVCGMQLEIKDARINS